MRESIKQLIIFVLITGVFASCSTDIEEINETQDVANNVTERVDIKIIGEPDEYIYEESMESDPSIDLVSYHYFGNPSNKFGFEVELDEGFRLKIMICDLSAGIPWTQVGQSFGVFAAQQVETKSRYVIFEIINSIGESQMFSSNVESSISPQIDAFTIDEYDTSKKEILCRINRVSLFNENDHSEVLKIDGTFRGAITFE